MILIYRDEYMDRRYVIRDYGYYNFIVVKIELEIYC